MKLKEGQQLGRWMVTVTNRHKTIVTRSDVDALDFEFFERQVWHKGKTVADRLQEVIDLTQRVEDDIGYRRGRREIKEEFHKLMKLDEGTSN